MLKVAELLLLRNVAQAACY